MINYNEYKVNIFAIREGKGAFYFNKKATNIYSLFKNIQNLTNSIDDKEKFNLYYTAANCKIGTREDYKQEVIPFDIDGINTHQVTDYIDEAAKVLKVNINTCGVVFTGNGLHILIPVKPFDTKSFFKTYKKHYKAWCQRINVALREAGLPGNADPSVFSSARLLRLPFTKNIKPKKGEKFAKLLYSDLKVTDWDISSVSIQDSEKLSSGERAYPKPDVDTITKDCEFLKYAYENRATLEEPLWFTALNVTAFFEDDDKWSHKISEGHPGYTYEQTQTAIERIRNDVSGPRTCEDIDTRWDGCSKCQHYGKCKTPLQIPSERVIASESSQFTAVTEKGKVIRYYDDLLKAFKRDTKYIHLDQRKRLLAYSEGKYEHITEDWVKNYAQTKFKKPVKTHEVNEFYNLVKRSNITPNSFVDGTNARGLVNLANGVFNLDTKELMPHSPGFGFQYKINYKFDQKATCPTWDKLLDNVTCGNKKHQQIIMEYIAFILRGGAYHPEKILVLSGRGNNGKSTITDIIEHIVGSDNCSSFDIRDFDQPFNVAGLEGKLVNFCQEQPAKVFSETSMLKKIVGGDGVQASYKYENTFTFRPNAKFIISYNEVPYLKDTTPGMLRRLMILPFELDLSKSPDKKIKNVKAKCLKELPGIFNKIVQAYDSFKERGFMFEESERSKQLLQSMVYDSDSVYAWWEDRIVITNNDEDRLERNEMYLDFREEMEVGKETHKLSQKRFIQRVKILAQDKNLEYKKTRIDGKPAYGICGIKLNGDRESEY